MKLPPLPKLPPFLEGIYGEESPYRIWAFVLTAFIFLLLFKDWRRFAWTGIICTIIVYFIGGWLVGMMKEFTPDR